MKLKVGKTVYLQGYEVAFIASEPAFFPASILQEAFSDSNDFDLASNSVNEYQFGYVFEDPRNVKWLMRQDWIVDYGIFAKKSPAELEVIGDNLEEKIHAIVKAFNARDEEYREKHFSKENERLRKIGHKLDSIEILIGHLRGEVEFILPDAYQAKAILRVKHSFLAWLFGQSAQ